MAIVKNGFRVSRLDGDFSPESVSIADDDDELSTQSSASESDGSDISDVDSGIELDEYDLGELGEPGTEFCQVGNSIFSIPFELYDLQDLGSVLSVDTWNNCLSEEERFALAEYLPDMDQETFELTLKELLAGKNLYFSSPLVDFFSRLKGGLCEPSVALFRLGLNFFQKNEHYHLLRKYQNSMVGSLVRIRDAWENCAGYGIEERLRFLNIARSQRPLSYGRDGVAGSETDLENEGSGEAFWNRRLNTVYRAVHKTKSSFAKENSKGFLKVDTPKVSVKECTGVVGRFSHRIETKARPPASLLTLPRQDHVAGFDLGTARKTSNRMRGDGDDDDLLEQGNEISVRGDRNAACGGSTKARASLLKPGKKQEVLTRYHRDTQFAFSDEDSEDSVGLPHSLSKSRNAGQMVTIASYDPRSSETMKNTKYPEKDCKYPAKGRAQPQVLKGAHVDWSDRSQLFRRSSMQEEVIPVDHSAKLNDRIIRSKIQNSGEEFRTGKSKIVPDSKVRSHKTFPAQMGNSYFHYDHRAKTSQEKIRSKYALNGEMDMEYPRGSIMFAHSEETESDSSDHDEEDEDVNPLVRKSVYPGGAMEDLEAVFVGSKYDPKKANKLAKKDKKGYAHVYTPEVEPYSSKGKQKGLKSEASHLHDYKSMKKGQVSDCFSEKLLPQILKSYSTERKRKGMADPDQSLLQSNYLHDYDSGMLDEGEKDLDGSSKLLDDRTRSNRLGNRGHVTEAHTVEANHRGRSNMPLSGYNSVTKKRKGKVDVMNLDEPDESVYPQSSPKKQVDDPSLMRKKGKRKVDAETGTLAVGTPDPIVSEKGTADVEQVTMLQKKPFTLITPTVHSGFSFSIIHLLSAVRKVMITSIVEDTTELGTHLDKNDGRQKPITEDQNKALQVVNGTPPSHSHEDMDANAPGHAGQKNLHSLTVQEIVDRLRSNPGDPCILETQEPLQDLVRGVLKIFSSKTAPLGAKGWKALVFYEKSNKSWSWIGPVPSSLSDNDSFEEETSSEAWYIPHKMLVKLVDAFANWLKSGQETLKQIGSLPAPPTMMSPNLDEKERFRDLRAQKSLNTISPSSDEVRAYFRREEVLRYSVPDRAFSYTAADGKKSIVAPLRRGGGKPTSKARDHFMLKPDRPPHVTILCIVRDATARLPGSIGTRSDVCTLMRDSQYIVEDVSDAQITQVVSGALDRLHYERDPCVMYDAERKLWVYRHRDREEEDFEDDGTSSTKKWKRPRKDGMEHSAMRAVNDDVTGDLYDGCPSGHGTHSNLNVDSSSFHMEEKRGLVCNDIRPNMDNTEPFIASTLGNRSQGNPVRWEALCQENSTNEDFDDELFSRERPVGLLNASLS